MVRLGIRGITALEWNSAAKEASLVEAARTMKEAIQSCGWRQLWHRARKRGKKKKRKKKKHKRCSIRGVKKKTGSKIRFSANIFSLLVYHARIWAFWRRNGGVSNIFSRCSFSFFSRPPSFLSVYHRYLLPRVQSSVRRKTPPPACCLWEAFVRADAPADDTVRLCCGPSSCFAGRRTPVKDKGGLVERRPLSLSSRTAICIRSWCQGD